MPFDPVTTPTTLATSLSQSASYHPPTAHHLPTTHSHHLLPASHHLLPAAYHPPPTTTTRLPVACGAGQLAARHFRCRPCAGRAAWIRLAAHFSVHRARRRLWGDRESLPSRRRRPGKSCRLQTERRRRRVEQRQSLERGASTGGCSDCAGAAPRGDRCRAEGAAGTRGLERCSGRYGPQGMGK